MAIIVLFAAALRCDQITERSIWFDEAFSWTLASQFGLSEVITRTAQDVHPPLYYLILSAWVSVFGQSLLAMRLLSVLLGTAAVLAAFLVGKAAIRAFECIAKQGRDPSIIAPTEDGTWLGMSFAILLAVSPFQIHWSGEVRMYSLLTLLFLLSVLFGLQALSGSRSRRLHWAGLSLTSAAMVYTHNVGLFSFGAESLFFFSASLYLSRRTCDAAVPMVVRDCVIAIGVVGLIYLP